MIVGLCLASTFALQAQITQIGVQHTKPGTYKQATGSNRMHIPGALAFDHYNGSIVQRKIVMPWSTNHDGTGFTGDWAVSTNGGMTFGATQTGIEPVTNRPIDIPTRAMIKRRATGVLLSYPFGWNSQPAAHSMTFIYWSSTDRGTIWKSATASVDFIDPVSGLPIPVYSMHFERGLLEENDGTLYAMGYGMFQSDSAWREILIKSTNDGSNWSYVSTMAVSATHHYTEGVFARCLNGSWLSVFKSSLKSGGEAGFLYVRSTDQGLTWTPPLSAPGITSIGNCDVELNLMPNGILVLAYGPESLTGGASRDLKVAFSADGNGTSWTNLTTIHTSTLWDPGDAITAISYESSGYTAVPAVSAHRFLHVSDTGHSWSYDSTAPSPNPFSIRGRYVDIVRTNEINRIDLKTKLALGTITVTTANTVPLNTWSLIRIQATISSPASAAVTVNGVPVGSAGKNATGPSTMDGFSFAGGGTAPVGDNALFDDVVIN